MNYQDAINFLYDSIPMFHRIGPAAFKPDLSNITALSEYLGNPEKGFKSIHIAGTNGKGSTAHMLAAILQEAGYKVGLYTSPHYRDFRERIKINGEYIPENEVVSFILKTKDFTAKIKPSFFELTAAMSFYYFNKEKVDVAIIEVGMGGRLDATNIINPECSVITNIGYDHEQFLGNTLGKIATEKAGIIKNNIPTVIGEYNVETFPVFEAIAEKQKSEIYAAFEIFDTKLKYSSIAENIFDIYSQGKLYLKDLKIGLTGNYQEKNLKTVLATVNIINKKGFLIKEENIRTGLKEVKNLSKIIGRWDIVQHEKPIIICDSAHNSHGLAYVKSALDTIPHDTLHIVFGMVSDKDPGKLLKELPRDAIFYFCKADIPRGLESEKLLEAATELGLKGNIYESVRAAYLAAKKTAKDDDLIFIGGSIFVVAEII